MKRLASFAFLLLPLLALAAPATKPPIPTSVAFTQGLVTRSLTVTSQNCVRYVETPINGEHGQRRFQLMCGSSVQGSWVQFNADGGPIYAAWIWPDMCGAKPPPFVQYFACPFGTTGDGFSLTHGWACVNGTWQATAWVPPWVPPPPSAPDPPPGACTDATPPPSLTPPVLLTSEPMARKPARGTTVETPHYGTTYNRITDHAADRPQAPWIRNDYSRRQPLNADGTRLLVDCNNGWWCVYDVSDPTRARFLEQLNGPAGDAELQWADADTLYFLPINGGTVLRQVKVSTNVSTTVWDFTAQVTAFWPTARRCWTKSEGSPSADGRFWGLMCETDGFAPLGFVVLDVVNKSVVWHANNSVRPDHVSMSPSGRWFEVSGDDPRGTVAYGIAADVQGQTRQLHHKSEHSDLGLLPNGHDFYVSIDYQTDQGDVFWEDLEDPAGTRHVIFDVYGHPNPIFGTNYAFHFSGKAYGKPGWVLSSNYGVPPANIVWIELATARMYGVGISYAIDSNYFDEVQAVVSRDGSAFFYNDNFGGPSQTGDVFRGTLH